MDKRNSKKTEQTKHERKDRGDNLKKVEKVVKKVLDSVEEIKTHYPGGDSERKLVKVDKPRVIVFKKSEDIKPKVAEHRSKENLAKKIERDDAAKGDNERKKIKDKNALKPKGPVGVTVKKEEAPKLNVKLPVVEVRNDRPPKKPIELKSKIETIDSAASDLYKKKDSYHRKPLIKTVTAKNDSTKVFKAVTFVDQKKPTLLQIKIPTEVRNAKRAETNVVKKLKAVVSGVSLKEKGLSLKEKGSSRRKSNKGAKRTRRVHPASPDLSVRIRSPPTEVAKWAPSSINRHTKPYYEAWVNTTLAAISKNARKDKLFLEKQNVLQSFQRALAERPETPELVYENFADERYTGRIKVKQRS